MPVYIDISEFMGSPHRTGIQRVCGELIRNWRDTEPLVPVKLGRRGELVHLPADTLPLICEYFAAGADDTADLAERIRNAGQHEGPRAAWEDARLLVPEVFYDTPRVDFYNHADTSRLNRVFFLIYDLLPLTHPQFYRAGMPIHIVGEYFRMIRRAQHPAFISRAVRNAYYERLVRAAGKGRVLRLGSDSLRNVLRDSPASPSAGSLRFTVVGTIEPRKRHLQILRAFEPLLQSMRGLSLVFAGRLGWLDSADARELQAARSWPGFEWIEDPSDAAIADIVSKSRATVFLSAAEGFGLPPVESLALGVPVIASEGIPSLEDTDGAGVKFTADDVESIREAVCALCDDTYYVSKRAEAESLQLPTWASFAEDVQEWITSDEMIEPQF